MHFGLTFTAETSLCLARKERNSYWFEIVLKLYRNLNMRILIMLYRFKNSNVQLILFR